MNILCVIDCLGSGGAQRQLINLGIGFKEQGHNVSFLTYHTQTFYSKLLESSKISINIITEPNYFRRTIEMRKFIRNGNFHCVLSFLEAPNFICEIASLPYRKWKLIVGERSANPKILNSFKLKLFRWFHVFADHIIANSYENLKIVRRINPFIRSSHCHVIYNLIDFEKWKPQRTVHPSDDKKIHILVAASHRYLKNLNGLIEAVNLLSKDQKSRLRISWYGDSSSDTSLSEGLIKIKNFGLIDIFSFYEPVLEITEIINKCDVIGLFSFYEGLPNTICEGMAMGKMVIASDVSDLPIIMRSDKNCLFDPNNIFQIKESLQYILSLSKAEMRIKGEINRQISIELFNKQKILNEYLNIIEN